MMYLFPEFSLDELKAKFKALSVQRQAMEEELEEHIKDSKLIIKGECRLVPMNKFDLNAINTKIRTQFAYVYIKPKSGKSGKSGHFYFIDRTNQNKTKVTLLDNTQNVNEHLLRLHLASFGVNQERVLSSEELKTCDKYKKDSTSLKMFRPYKKSMEYIHPNPHRKEMKKSKNEYAQQSYYYRGKMFKGVTETERKYNDYQKKTGSIIGYIQSFFSCTDAYKARKALSKSLDKLSAKAQSFDKSYAKFKAAK
jgi:hypothetical protein